MHYPSCDPPPLTIRPLALPSHVPCVTSGSYARVNCPCPPHIFPGHPGSLPARRHCDSRAPATRAHALLAGLLPAPGSRQRARPRGPQACPQAALGGASWAAVPGATEGRQCARSGPCGPACYMLFEKRGDSNPRKQADVVFRCRRRKCSPLSSFTPIISEKGRQSPLLHPHLTQHGPEPAELSETEAPEPSPTHCATPQWSSWVGGRCPGTKCPGPRVGRPELCLSMVRRGPSPL